MTLLTTKVVGFLLQPPLRSEQVALLARLTQCPQA